MKKILFCSILVLCSNLFAQKKINFEMDYARFRYDSVSNFIEFYYLIDASALVATSNGGKSLKQAILNFNIFNQADGDTLIYNNYRFEKVVDSTDENKSNNNQVGIVAYVLPEGEYNLEVTVMDYNNLNNFKKIQEKIKIDPYGVEEQKISDIELAVNIQEAEKESKSLFFKNSYEVTPNPSILYSNASPAMFYYTEIYNLDSALDTTYLLNKTLINSRNIIIAKQPKRIRTNSKSILEVGVIPLNNYPTDTYTFLLELVNPITQEISNSSKKFFLYNPEVKDTINNRKQTGSYIQSEFSVMSEEECDLMFEEVMYIAAEVEIEEYEDLKTLDTKREYLYYFWSKRDKDPTTLANEYKNEYMRRVDFTNQSFGNFNEPGYKSDRGRIYLKYGSPDDIDRYPNEQNLKPYEIWNYQSIEGGVYFVFADVNGFSSYRLLHSTKSGEMKDTDWQRRISTE